MKKSIYILFFAAFIFSGSERLLADEDMELYLGSRYPVNVQSLIEKGTDINARYGTMRDTALLSAARSNKIKVVTYLLKKGANVDIGNETGGSPLGTAVMFNHLAVAKALIDAGANVNHLDQFGQPPLLIASKARHPDAVKLLLAHHADVHFKDQSGTSALHLVFDSTYGDSEQDIINVTNLLLKAGIDINGRTNNGATALQYAVTESNISKAIINLIEQGADINLAMNDGYSPLYAACKYTPEVAKILLRYGAKKNVYWKGKRPIDIARRNHPEAHDLISMLR